MALEAKSADTNQGGNGNGNSNGNNGGSQGGNQGGSQGGNQDGSQGGNNSGDNNVALDIENLPDGIYSLTGNMVKTDKVSASMSDNAINHLLKLTVKDGKYYLTMNFEGLTIGTSMGYLSELKYFLTGYTTDAYGVPQGALQMLRWNPIRRLRTVLW